MSAEHQGGTTMNPRRRVSGRFELPICAADAISFFTPEGERSWVPGWNPTYPAGAMSEDPGTVFITSHTGIETVWIVEGIDRARHTSSYARVTMGHHAGTVRVRCNDQPDDRCVVTVDYDMTAFTPSRPATFDAYNDDSFAAMMVEWATRVTAVLTSNSPM